MPVNVGSKRVRMLGGDNYAMFKLSAAAPIGFAVGDWAEVEGETMYVVTLPECTRNSDTGGYDYTITLHGAEKLWANRLLRLNPGGASELSFKLTAPIARHADLILKCLKYFGLKYEGKMDDSPEEFDCAIDEDVTKESRLVSYDGTDMLTSLDDIASTFETEWWREGRTIRFGRCFKGEEMILGQGSELSTVTPSGSGGNVPNRIHAYGGSDNVPPWYRRHLVMTAEGDGPEFRTDRALTSGMFRESVRYLPDGCKTEVSFGSQTSVGTNHIIARILGECRYNLLPGQTYAVDTENLAFYVTFEKEGKPWKFDNPLNVKIEITDASTSSKEKLLTGDRQSAWASNSETERKLAAPHLGVLRPTTAFVGNYDNWSEEETGTPRFCGLIYMVTLYYDSGNPWVEPKTFEGITIKVRAEGAMKIKVLETEVYPSFRGLTLRNIDTGDVITDVEYNPDNLQPTADFRSLPFRIPITSDIRKGDRLTLDTGTILRYEIPEAWWQDGIEDAVVDAAVSMRLRLPQGHPYIDAYEGIPGHEVVEKMVSYDDVFPRQDYEVTRAVSLPRENTSSNGGDRFFSIWAITASAMRLSRDCLISKEGLRIAFTSGTLNGLTFEAILRDGTEISETEGEPCIEIVRDDSSGRMLPNDVLHPGEGDKFNLLGWADDDETDRLITAAEEELLEKATEDMSKAQTEGKTYECKILPLWAREHGIPAIGRNVSLESPALFTRGTFRTRVLGYEYPLDIPFDNPTVTLGDSLPKKRLAELEKAVRENGSIGDTSVALQDSEGWSGVFTADLTNQADTILFNDLGEQVGTLPRTEVSAWVDGEEVSDFSLSISGDNPGVGLAIEGHTVRVASADETMPAEVRIGITVTCPSARTASGKPGERKLWFTLIRRRGECRYSLSLSASSLHRKWNGPMHEGSDYSGLHAVVVMEDVQGARLLTIQERTKAGLKVHWRSDTTDWQTTKPDIDTGTQWVECRLMQGDICLDVETVPIVTDGTPDLTEDTGKWTTGKAYLNDGVTIQDVWHLGNRWRCMASHTSTVSDAPGFGNPLWEWIGGDPELHLGFAEAEQLYPVSDIHIPLTLVATYHGEDVTQHIADADIVWSRESETADGIPRTAMDAAWNALHAPTGTEPYGKSVVLEETDCQTEKGGWSQGVGMLKFMVEATLRDPATQAVRKARATYDA